MLKKIESWLFRWLFPKQRAMIMHAAKSRAEQDLKHLYEKKFRSLQRSPLDESVWVRKFTTLDADYAKLEKEATDTRIENRYLRMKLRKLEDLK